jgi:HK97 family phage major capsid protein
MNLQDMMRLAGVTADPQTRSSVQLRQERAQLVQSMRDVTDAAERMNRNLNAEERTAYTAAERRFYDLTEQITAAEEREAEEAANARTIGDSSATFRTPDRRASEAVVLTAGQSMAEHVRNLGYRAEGEQNFRFGHMIRGMLLGDWRGAELERRALLESNAGSGGVLVPAPMSARVLDVARAQVRVMQAGAVTVPMESSTLKIGRQTGDPSPLAWHTEAAVINESNLTFDSVTLTAHTLPCLVKLSLEMLEDVDNIDSLVTNAVARVMALEVDRAALRGSGTDPEPRGLRTTTGVTILEAGGADGAAATWETLIAAVAAVKGNNYQPNASIHAVRTEVDLGKQKDTTGQYLVPPPLLDDVRRLDTTQVPINLTKGLSTDASEMYAGQWDQLMIGMRTAFTVQPLNELYADTGERGILCHLRMDVAPAHAAAFAIVDGVTAAA